MMPTVSIAIPALEVVGAGAQGIGEMVQWMEDTEVMWAILRFDFGAGAFKRTKMVFLHFNGEDTPVVRRGQANSKTDRVSALLRGKDGIFHASITRTEAKEVTIESIMTEVSKNFVIDSMDSPVALMKAYHEQLAREAQEAREAEEKRAVQEKRAGPFGLQQPMDDSAQPPVEVTVTTDGTESKPQTDDGTATAGTAVSEVPSTETTTEPAPRPRTSQIVLPKSMMSPENSGKGMMPRKSIRVTVKPGFGHVKDVGNANGLLDWVVILPDPNFMPLLGAGSEGVCELRKLVEANEDKVMYALLRIHLGQGSMERAKWIFLHIIGNSTKVIRRGRWNAVKTQMERKFKEFANVSASLSDLDSEDITEELIIQELKKYSVADDDIAAADKTDKVDVQKFKTRLNQPKAQMELAPLTEEDEEEEEEVVEEPAPPRDVTAATMATTRTMESIDEEEEEIEVEEEVPEEAPNSDKSMFEVLSMVRESREANWGLFAPKGKSARK